LAQVKAGTAALVERLSGAEEHSTDVREAQNIRSGNKYEGTKGEEQRKSVMNREEKEVGDVLGRKEAGREGRREGRTHSLEVSFRCVAACWLTAGAQIIQNRKINHHVRMRTG